MALISSSLMTNSLLQNSKVSQGLGIANKVAPKATAAVQNVVTNATNAASSMISGVENAIVKKATDVISPVVSKVDAVAQTLEQKAEGYITSGIGAFSDVFTGGEKAMVSKINGLFGKTFDDTATAASTTIKTDVSDPVKTLLSTDSPVTAGYKFTSGTGAPTAISLSGTTSLATGTASLNSNQIQTLRNRYNLDDLTDLSSILKKTAQATGVSAAYTDLFGAQDGSVLSTVSGAGTGVVNSVTESLGKTVDLLDSGSTSLIADVLPDFTSGTTFTDVNDSAKSIFTSNTNVSTSNVNSFVALAKDLGCNGVSRYASQNVTTGAGNILLALVANSGLSGMVQQLLDCDALQGTKIDSTLSKIALYTAGQSPATTNALLGGMTTPATLNTQAFKSAVVTNPSLTKQDVPAVTQIFSQINADPVSTYAVADTTAGMPTYDYGLISSTQPDVLDSIFQSQVYSDLTNASECSLTSDGTLSF